MRAACALLVLCAAAGCALKAPPAHDSTVRDALPNLQVPEKWAAEPRALAAKAETDGWLAEFHDPQLDALVREVLRNNPDLRVAAARVEQAAAYVKAAGATLYPQVSALARGGGTLSGDSSGLQGAGIFANWELDVWGRVRAGRESSSIQYSSAALDTEYARQSLAALAAKSWFLATEARLQKGIAEDMVASMDRQLGLAEDRLRIGRGDQNDVTLARASVATYRDSVRSLEYAYRQSLRALESLAGRYPAGAIEVPAQLAAIPGEVPVGLPSELLERRPDVVAAERRVAAAFYRVEEAKAARLPRISLTAAVTSISSDLFVLKDRDNPVWSAGAAINAPLFLGGQLQAQIDVRTAEQKQAVAEYGAVGSRAFSEVESALSAVFTLHDREELLKQAVAENTRALDFANVRYRVGVGDLRAVQQQALALDATRTALLRVQAERLVQRVNLHLALGGSFEAKP
ncbi:MAG TPA: efflux transporter outer membrane subunit [Burkholderiales bacterium]|jgi:NodT family efflux transporter outer membrane factor (OMF) lipoprotein|nr:efflux transporter outer membrane subunit [Burkholderiales bacterium]